MDLNEKGRLKEYKNVGKDADVRIVAHLLLLLLFVSRIIDLYLFRW